MNEQELAAAVVAYLRDDDWEVYQEVQLSRSDIVADIVATRGPLMWVIECKRGFGLPVLAQAYRWRGYANCISVAVPAPHHCGEFATRLLEWSGIGVLDWYSAVSQVTELQAPALRRRIIPRLRDRLCEEQKTWAPAGNARSDRFTPFKQTCRALVTFVQQHPGRTMKEAVAGIEHHYSSSASARSALYKWLLMDYITGIEMRFDDGKCRLFPAEDRRGEQ